MRASEVLGEIGVVVEEQIERREVVAHDEVVVGLERVEAAWARRR